MGKKFFTIILVLISSWSFGQITIQTSSEAEIYEIPFVKSKVLKIIPPNTIITITERVAIPSRYDNYFHVSYDSTNGWVYNIDVVYNNLYYLALQKCSIDSVLQKHYTDLIMQKCFNDSIFGSMTDSRDGKTYKTINIGNQTWLAVNLAYKTNSGCWAYNNDQNNVSLYGYLYNWKTAKNVCPLGWHIPSDTEWISLTTYLEGEDFAGINMKSIYSWNENGDGTNSSGFSALASGYRDRNGVFSGIGDICRWWTDTEFDVSNAWSRVLSSSSTKMHSIYYSKSIGLSIRCIKDR